MPYISTCFRFYTQKRVQKKKHLHIEFIVSSHNSVAQTLLLSFIFKWSCLSYYAYMSKGQLMLSIFLGNCPRHLFHKVHQALCFWLFRNGRHQKGCLLCSFVTKNTTLGLRSLFFVSSSYPRSWATSMHIMNIFSELFKKSNSKFI